MCALSQFEFMCKKIISGDITVMELELIKSKSTQMKKLHEVATAGKTNLEMRLKELDWFTSYHNQLKYFITQMNTICIEGR